MTDFPGGSDGKESDCNMGDLGSIPWLGRSPGGGHVNPLQYCLENPHGQRSLVGHSPWGHKESDMTKHTDQWQPLHHPSCHWQGSYTFETSLGTLASQPLCWFVSFSSNTMYHGILHEIRISYFMVHCIKLSFLRIHLLLRCSVVSNSLRPHALEPARLLCPWDSSTKNPGVGHHFLLQGILETLGLNSNLLCCLHWQVDSLPLAPPEKPLRVHTCGQK